MYRLESDNEELNLLLKSIEALQFCIKRARYKYMFNFKIIYLDTECFIINVYLKDCDKGNSTNLGIYNNKDKPPEFMFNDIIQKCYIFSLNNNNEETILTMMDTYIRNYENIVNKDTLKLDKTISDKAKIVRQLKDVR